jgi:hypothetical protein
MLSALHTINTYPFDLAAPIFAHYPAMKLGHLESVSAFAELLAPMALQMIGDAPAEDAGWVLTSPPLHRLPSGANLVCRALRGLLAKALPAGQAPQLASIAVRWTRRPLRTAAEFEDYNGYSKLDLDRRHQQYSARRGRLICDGADFAGRSALFVNDINVTGTQLAEITRLLHDAGVKRLDILLIVQVDREIGCAFPQLEHEINTSRIGEPGEFVACLRDGEFEPTAKLIWRLLSHDTETLAAIFDALRAPKRRLLYRAILQEDLYGGPLFEEKMRIVRRAASDG